MPPLRLARISRRRAGSAWRRSRSPPCSRAARGGSRAVRPGRGGPIGRDGRCSGGGARRKAPSGFKWNWDNTITYGLGFRVSDPDKRHHRRRGRRHRRSRSTVTTGTRTTRRASSRTPRRSRASSSSATRTSAASSAASRSTTSRTRTATGPAPPLSEATRRTGSAAAPKSVTRSLWDRFKLGTHPGETARRLAGDQLGREHVHPGRHQRRQPGRRQRPARAGLRTARRAAAGGCRQAQHQAVRRTRPSKGSTSTPGKRRRSTRSAATSARPTWPALARRRSCSGSARCPTRWPSGTRPCRRPTARLGPRCRRAPTSKPVTADSTAWPRVCRSITSAAWNSACTS